MNGSSLPRHLRYSWVGSLAKMHACIACSQSFHPPETPSCLTTLNTTGSAMGGTLTAASVSPSCDARIIRSPFGSAVGLATVSSQVPAKCHRSISLDWTILARFYTGIRKSPMLHSLGVHSSGTSTPLLCNNVVIFKGGKQDDEPRRGPLAAPARSIILSRGHDIWWHNSQTFVATDRSLTDGDPYLQPSHPTASHRE